jgi:hypothetical protein
MRNINENQINGADAKAIFKTASTMRDTPTGMGRILKSRRKSKIDMGDLQRAWQEAGYPDDIRDIEHILRDFGFDKKEINKVFGNVFGKSDKGEYNEPTASPAILKIAEYAKKAGIDKELIAFMQKEYGFKESHEFEGKAVVEDVRKIFTAIVNEERAALPQLIKSAEQQYLGRSRK